MDTRRVRVIVDMVMDDAKLPSEHQQNVVANNVNNYLHLGLGIQDILTEDDVAISAAHPHFTVHVHDASGQFCEGCALAAQDGLS